MGRDLVEEIITASQVSAILKIHVKTVYRLAEEGVIPGNRIGGAWRFRKSNILDLVPSKERKALRGRNQPWTKKSAPS